ncbi:MAG: transcription termination factor Rho [Lachnospiraceae bacterium]|nr:transcription termination factor Rho [Lachnospiraceae bacterium]
MATNYNDMSLVELRGIAKERGLKVSSLRKKELINLLESVDIKLEELRAKGQEKKEKEQHDIDDNKNIEKKSEDDSEVKKTRKTRVKKSDNIEEIKEEKKEIKKETKKDTKKIIKENKEDKEEPSAEKKEKISEETDNKNDIQKNKGNEEELKNKNSDEEAKPVRRTQDNYKNNKYNSDYNKNKPQNRQEYYKKEYAQREHPQKEYTQREFVPREQENPDKTEAPKPRPSGEYQGVVFDTKGVTLDNIHEYDSGETKTGILEVLSDGYGFIRCDNYLPGENDVYVSPSQIRRFNLKTGDIIVGNTKVRLQNEKFSALLFIKSINGFSPLLAQQRPKFEELTPIFPDRRIRLERPGCNHAMRMVDIVSPVGTGQRGMIVSPPKAGKTTLLKQVAKSITQNYPEKKLIILLIDERPEEVTDIKESIEGNNVEVIYSTFDELPENHRRVSEMVIERGKRLVEHKMDVVILLDSITRLARAYNLTVQPSGRTLSGGLDPAALHMPKKFFGAARNMREGGSLTILATALVDTGSRMDDVVFEEFKGTGNMELVLDRALSEKRIFPAIDLAKSSTRRDDLLLSKEEADAANILRKALSGMKSEEALERIIDLFVKTKSNQEFIHVIKKTRLV